MQLKEAAEHQLQEIIDQFATERSNSEDALVTSNNQNGAI